jgi:hypothetical protein
MQLLIAQGGIIIAMNPTEYHASDIDASHLSNPLILHIQYIHPTIKYKINTSSTSVVNIKSPISWATIVIQMLKLRRQDQGG